MDILLGIIVYGFTLILMLTSVVAAIYEPALGFTSWLALMALYLDKNKEVFRKFFVSPSVFFRRHMFVSGGHRAYFFAAVVATIVNLTAALVRFL